MKQSSLTVLFFILLSISCFSQVKIGGAGNPDPNAVLELDGGTNRGLLLPRLTTVEMTAMSTAANGMMIFNSTEGSVYIRKAGNWIKLADGGNSFSFPHTSSHGLPLNYVLDLENFAAGSTYGAIIGRSGNGNGIAGISSMGNGVVGTAGNGNGGYFSANQGFAAIQTGTGSVSVGTATTTKGKLVVKGNSGNVSAMFGEDQAGITLQVSSPAIGFNSYYINSRKAMANGYGGYIELNPVSGKLSFYNSSNPGTADNDITMDARMTISKEGNVGIQGNTNPHSPLAFGDQLGNKIAFWGNSPGSHYGFGIQASLFQMYAGSAADDIVFGYGSSQSFTENMRIKGNGHVGIGTSTPYYPVTLASTSHGFVQSGGGVEVGTAVSATAGIIRTYSNHPLHFAAQNNNPQMALTQGGDLGVGILTPLARIHVRGNGGDLLLVNNSASLAAGVSAKTIYKSGNYYTGMIGTYGTGAFSARMGFSTYASANSSLLVERMSILDNGNVGINIITPEAKLDVMGKTKITQGAGDDAALEISGSIRVSGIKKAAFTRSVSSADLLISDTYIIIDHPDSNNDPNAILFVTPRTSTPFWVGYDGAIGKWKLYTGGSYITGFSQHNFKMCSDNCQLLKILHAQEHSFGTFDEFNILVIKSSF